MRLILWSRWKGIFGTIRLSWKKCVSNHKWAEIKSNHAEMGQNLNEVLHRPTTNPSTPTLAHASPHQMHLATAFVYCQQYSYTIAPRLPLIMLMHVSLRRNVDHYVQNEGVKSGSLVHLKPERLPLYCICIIDEHFAHCCSFCPSGIINSCDLISHPCMESCDVTSSVTSEWCTRQDVPFVSTWPVNHEYLWSCM